MILKLFCLGPRGWNRWHLSFLPASCFFKIEWFGICSSVSNTPGMQNGLGGLKDAFVKNPSQPSISLLFFFQGYDPKQQEALSSQPLVFRSPFSAPLIPTASLPYPCATTMANSLIAASLDHCHGQLRWLQFPEISPMCHCLMMAGPHTASFTWKQMTNFLWLSFSCSHSNSWPFKSCHSGSILPLGSFPSMHLSYWKGLACGHTLSPWWWTPTYLQEQKWVARILALTGKTLQYSQAAMTGLQSLDWGFSRWRSSMLLHHEATTCYCPISIQVHIIIFSCLMSPFWWAQNSDLLEKKSANYWVGLSKTPTKKEQGSLVAAHDPESHDGFQDHRLKWPSLAFKGKSYKLFNWSTRSSQHTVSHLASTWGSPLLVTKD